jgi:tubulin-specific chaperone E
MENQRVGCRIKDSDGFFGTIRYIGPVAHAKNTTDTYVGIEWDNEKRGKHDGSCPDKAGKLHRYFTCGETAGSFAKPNKIITGRTFLEALRERYVQLDAPLVAPDNIVPGAFVQTSKGQQKPIELVGETKIRKWQQVAGLDRIAIRGDSISSAGDDLEEHIGHMVEVDLQDNLFTEWKEISRLVSQMPKLRTLLLHGNKMEAFTPTIASALPPDSFSTLTVLALNGCGVSCWKEVYSP